MTEQKLCGNIYKSEVPFATVAQSVERRLGKAEVTGSSPVSSFVKSLDFQGFSFF